MNIKVTCAILERDGLVLITQRSEKMKQPLLWEFPGGKVEAGESEEESLIREIAEELHLQVVPVARLTPVVHRYGDTSIELIPYTCRFAGGTVKLQEHSAYAWAAPSDLLSYDWCPADLPIVEEYLRLRQGH